MGAVARLLLAAPLLLLSASSLLAQNASDPSGHWAGAIHVPPFNGAGSRDIAIEIDLARTAAGVPSALFSQPDQHVKGLPLTKVTFEGRNVSFELKANGGGLFRGTLADAASMSGELLTADGGYAIPFTLTRTGDAHVAPAPRSPAIGKELEGTWAGTIEVGGKQERLVLKMANHPDGSASGTILDLDGSNVEIAIAIAQQERSLTIDVATVGASYVASLTADARLVGTWKQGSMALPLTFTRGDK